MSFEELNQFDVMDSGYDSLYNVSHHTPSGSSFLTPKKIGLCFETISQTPVSQNIVNFRDFHTNTPKYQSSPIISQKQNSDLLNFEAFQSNRKKKLLSSFNNDNNEIQKKRPNNSKETAVEPWKYKWFDCVGTDSNLVTGSTGSADVWLKKCTKKTRIPLRNAECNKNSPRSHISIYELKDNFDHDTDHHQQDCLNVYKKEHPFDRLISAGSESRSFNTPQKSCIENYIQLNNKSLITKTPSKKRQYLRSPHKSKRKLDITKRKEKYRRRFYNGVTHLNIIEKLEPLPILNHIFNMLANKDLYIMTLVSNNWKKIVNGNLKAMIRLQTYLSEWNGTKENNVDANAIKASPNLHMRIPFALRNYKLDVNHTTDITKNKFLENQKLVKTLQEDEKLTKCPRCYKSSKIKTLPIVKTDKCDLSYSEKLDKSIDANITPTCNWYVSQEAFSLSQFNLIEENIPSPFKKRKLNKSRFIDSKGSLTKIIESSILSYGECTGVACKFKFCLKCLCNYHPGIKCKISQPKSPSKLELKEILPGNDILSRKLKLKRKSLKRLCF